jgi:autotransporter-associated beta strand protein
MKTPFLQLTGFASLILLVLLTPVHSSLAGSATWNLNPVINQWNNSGNWTPTTIPNGPADIATFGVSNLTDLGLLTNTEVAAIVFSQNASAYTISEVVFNLTISGSGITNNSGIMQNFIAPFQPTITPFIQFTNNASAGSLTLFTMEGGMVSSRQGGLLQFFDNSTAEEATFHLEGGAVAGAQGGVTIFNDASTAASGTFVGDGGAVAGASGSFLFFEDDASAGQGTFTLNPGAVSGTSDQESTIGADLDFYDRSSAGDGTFIVNGNSVANAWGGVVAFQENSTAANGTFVANGGSVALIYEVGGGRITFLDSTQAGHALLRANGDVPESPGVISFREASTAEAASVELSGYGTLDISEHDAPGLTLGALAGEGLVLLGAGNLAVGSSGISTTFSGIFQDDGLSGTHGSVTKLGKGRLVLTGTNIYTGPTIVAEGELLTNNPLGSGTGTAAVQVNGGSLGGGGKIAGKVTVGGAGAPAHISPGTRGEKNVGKLTVGGGLVFGPNGVYDFQIDSARIAADKLIARGVTIDGAARFVARDLGDSKFAIGTVLMIIENRAATPIDGTFSNLSDGAIIRVRGVGSVNRFKVDYEGGDGNDLTLTVQ